MALQAVSLKDTKHLLLVVFKHYNFHITTNVGFSGRHIRLPLPADSTLPLSLKDIVSNIPTPRFSADFLWDVDPPCCACNFMGIFVCVECRTRRLCLELCFVSFSFIMRGSALLTGYKIFKDKHGTLSLFDTWARNAERQPPEIGLR